MKELWKKYSMIEKMAIYIFIVMIVTMIVGLVLIGTITFKLPLENKTRNGFYLINNTAWSLGNFIIGSKDTAGITIKLSTLLTTLNVSGSAIQLQIGLILAVICTPVLLGISVGMFGYSFYLKYKNK